MDKGDKTKKARIKATGEIISIAYHLTLFKNHFKIV